MIIERLGEATPLLDEMLNALHAEVIGEQLAIRGRGVSAGSQARDATPGEMLITLNVRTEDGWLVVPTEGIRWTQHGIEVNVQNRYARFHDGTWKAPIID